MRIMVDLNVLLDVAQRRSLFYEASEEVLARAREAAYEAVLPGHAIATLHYIMEKFADTRSANLAVDGLLRDFAVVGAGRDLLSRARALPVSGFEDSVVAAFAESCHCDFIVTRNTADFANSPVPARTPSNFLRLICPLLPPGAGDAARPR